MDEGPYSGKHVPWGTRGPWSDGLSVLWVKGFAFWLYLSRFRRIQGLGFRPFGGFWGGYSRDI